MSICIHSNTECAAAISCLQHIDRWLSYGNLSADRRDKVTQLSNRIETGAAIVEDTGHGFYVHDDPHCCLIGFSRQWYRINYWIPYANHLERDRLDVANPNKYEATGASDQSSVFIDGKTGKYNGKKCACCFLGHSHTVDYHNKLISDYDKMKEKYSR